MKRLCALIGALLVSWLTLGSPAPAAASVPTEDLAYNYASHHAPNPAASNDLMRGPPVLTKGLTTYDATHQRARSASSRSNGATTASINTYVPAAYVPADARPRVERATTTTGASGGVAERDLSSLSGAQDAANTGKALELSPASLNYPWPANNGFLGSTRVRVLKPGAQIDRYGPETGRFTSPAGTPRGMRSLRPGTTSDLSSYEVVRRLPAETGVVAPGFGETGLGIQYRLPAPVADLVRAGYLRPVG